MSPAEPLPAASQSNPFDAFLRPESMVTPGALGALTMLITNALANNFGVLTPGLIALIVSFILGVTALVKASSILQKIVYYVINSRIIFSVATGSNTLGRTAAAGGSPPRTAGIVLFPAAYAWPLEARLPHTPQAVHAVQFFKPWFQGSAAQESAPPAISPNDAESGWSVIVGSFNQRSDAEAMRERINRQLSDRYTTSVTQNPSNSAWAVTLGNDLSLADAARIQKQAISEGLASDTYIKRTSQLRHQ